MAPPRTLDLTGDRRALYAGDRYQIRVAFKDSTTQEPIDKSASTWLAQIRRTRSSPTPLVQFDVDDSDAGAGVILLTLDKTVVTTDLDGAVWDLQETSADLTKLTGAVECRGDVSRT